MVRTFVVVTALVAAASGCGEDPTEPPLFPVDYAATYQQVRDCRFSIDHDLVRMRVLASPDALGPYQDRTTPFPEGAIVLKELYDSSDDDCTGTLIGVSVMQKAAAATADLGWTWQETDGAFVPKADVEVPRCVSCHTTCGVAPTGYDGTCTEP